ncbi:MAG: TlpA disulfide reductase family protein [Bacteroidota bacterium]
MRLIYGLVFFACISLSSNAQFLKTGLWQGTIHYTEKKVPFAFEVTYPDGSLPQLTFINGQERRVISDVSFIDGRLIVPITPFDVELQAEITATSMKGKYVKNYRKRSFDFTATYGAPRLQKRSTRPSVKLEDRWAMTFEPDTKDASEGVGIFRQVGGVVYGTFLTKTSDYRYFEGIIDGDSLKMSSFDGAHAFMLLGKKAEGSWNGEIVFDDGYKESWKASADPTAELPDPFEMVKLEPGTHKPYYDLLAAGSGRNFLNPIEFQDKVVVIQLFGTWCPNSHDQTKFLTSWYRENKDRGVEIIAASYEADYSKSYGLSRLESYREANEIPYKMVLGGKLSKTDAATPFPFIKRISAFPTLVIVDKQGYARYVHSYFNGPATGAYYKEFQDRFNEIVDELLAE